MLRSRLATLSVAVVFAGGTLGACGGDEVAPGAYAQDLCSALGDWIQGIQEDAGSLTEGLTAESSPEEGKEAITNFLDQAVNRTETVIGEVEDAGTPEGNEDVHEAIVEALEQAQSTFEDAQAEAEDLPTDSPEAFQQAASDLGGSISSAQSDIQSTIDEVEPTDELQSALEEEEGCSQLQFQGG